MAYCSSCGAQQPLNASFCSQCGTKVFDQNANTLSGTENPKATVRATSALLPNVKKEALQYANHALLAFFYLFFCEVKGSDPFARQNLELTIPVYLVFLGVFYFCVIVQGINKIKPMFILIPTVLLVILELTIFTADFAVYNFYDWLTHVIGILQIAGLAYAYKLVKSNKIDG